MADPPNGTALVDQRNLPTSVLTQRTISSRCKLSDFFIMLASSSNSDELYPALEIFSGRSDTVDHAATPRLGQILGLTVPSLDDDRA